MQTTSKTVGASPGSAPLGGSGHVKHTPGPWHAATSEHYTLGGDQVEVVLLDKEGMVTDQICSVLLDTDDESKTGWRQQEANASLIAAAPDLLCALRAIVTHGEPIYPADWVKMKAAGLAALAKASGQNVRVSESGASNPKI